MFRSLGQFATQFRWPILAFWLIAAVGLTVVAPPLDSVTTDNQSEFLPADSDSIEARALLEQHFPASAESGNVVLVFDAGEGGNVLSEENAAFIQDMSLWLVGEDAPSGIQSVNSPTLVPAAAPLLVAESGRVAIVTFSLATGLDDDAQRAIVADIGERLEAAPASLTTYRTGQTFTFEQYNETIGESVGSTAIVTIVLVAVILLVIFRSPVSPAIPLFIVTIALMVTQGIVALLADGTLTVPSTATILLVVVVYGAGTDYCLFLISRFREELEHRSEIQTAARTSVHRVGESIFNSAATTVTGFLAMAFTQFGLYNTTGPVLAIAIFVTLAASLTLTPSILSLLGTRTFWPNKIKADKPTPRLYVSLSQFIKRYPAPIAAALLTGGIVLSVYGLGYETTFDFLEDMPQDNEAVEGFRLLESEMGAGELQPARVVIETDNPDLVAQSAELTQTILAVDGVADVRSATQPLGSTHQTANITRLDVQLGTLSAITAPSDVEPTEAQIAMMGSLIAALPDYLTIVTTYAPQLADDPNFAATLAALQASTDQPQFAELSAGLGGLAAVAPQTHVSLTELPTDVVAMFGGDLVIGLSTGYLSPDGDALRLEVILADGPYSTAALDTLDDLNSVLAANSTEHGIDGATASTLDIRSIMLSDLRLTIFLVMTGIFLILVIMLRSLVAPLYLIGTIALSFGTTLGLTRIASEALFDQAEFVFWVPFMIFVFLVALGIDYSIFLFSRIKEELAKDNDVTEAIFRTIPQTAGIIASAGAIVSGSFIALTTTDIVGLRQVGFAVGVGILIDTIIIRTVLVSSIALLFGRWSWFPNPIMNRINRGGERRPVIQQMPLPEAGD